jgi:hypothetical protein
MPSMKATIDSPANAASMGIQALKNKGIDPKTGKPKVKEGGK